MPIAALPNKLQSKLDVLARRLNRLRLLRGASITFLVLIFSAAVALGLDALLTLPPAVRFILTGLCFVSVAIVGWRELILPLFRAVTATDLAAAVEEEYPRLGERLMSTVEVTAAEDRHGSPAFVRMLIDETDASTRALDFRRAAPRRATKWLIVGTMAAAMLLVSPAAFIPDYYLGLGRRFVAPWDANPAVMPFAIDTWPGNGFAARGRPLTIAVGIRPTQETSALPEICTLVLIADDGKPLRLRMPGGDGPRKFAFHIDEVKSNFRYRLEAGPIETETWTVLAVEPVELASGPTTTLTPPAYAKTIGTQTVDGPADLSILEHGRIAIDCRFDRPAEAASLLLTSSGSEPASPRRLLLVLSDDHRSGRIELSALTSGKVRLELAAGHDITTLTPEQNLMVTPDRPPEFRLAAGLPEQGAVRPADVIPLDLAVSDDVAVAAVDVEYRVNDGPIQREPIPLAGLGSRQGAGHAEFKIAGKANDGDKLFVRLRATDNRNVPDAKLGPNVTTYPAGDHWSELRVAAGANPGRQTELTARRDDIEKRLREVIARVDQSVRRIDALHQNIDQGQAVADDQAKAVRELAGEQTTLSKQLAKLAADVAVAGMKPLADKMQTIGEQDFAQVDEALHDATAAADKERIPPLVRADSALAGARTKLDALLQENRDLAAGQLDEIKLNELADRERKLAEQTKPVVSDEERKKIADEQQRLADELKALTQNDDKLRDALREVRADEVRKFADQARRLAQAERELDAKLADAERRRNVAKLAELARQQQQLAADANRLAQQTQSSMQSAKAKSLDTQDLAKAADDLKAGDADAARQHQDQAARELDRLAGDLQRGVEAANDPREAAKLLARLQDENRKRLAKAEEKPLARRQQDAIHKSIEKIQVPEENTIARRERQDAADMAADAGRGLDNGDRGKAEFHMAQAKAALDQLAHDLPTVADRARLAREQVGQLQKTQEEVGRLIEAAAHASEKGDRQLADNKRVAAARKQVEVADGLAKLDAPAQIARRDQATRAANRALNDLRVPGALTLTASQADARHALERLAEALAGRPPIDDKIRELAGREHAVADAAAKAVGDPTVQRDLRQRQNNIVQETQALKAADAPDRFAEVIRAVVQAEDVLRVRPNDPVTPQLLRAAADKLLLLADRLAGRLTETRQMDKTADRDPPPRPEELARQQRELAQQTEVARRQPNAGQALQNLVEPQRRLRQQTERLPQSLDAAQQANRAMEKAERALARQDAVQAAEAQQQAANALDRATGPMAQTANPVEHDSLPEGIPNPRQVDQARDLAKRQRDLQDQLRRATATDSAPTEERNAANRQQGDMARQADNLARSLDQSGSGFPDQQSRDLARAAAAAARQGEQALQQAQGNDAEQAKASRKQAADALQQAAGQADRAAGKPGDPPNGTPGTGQQLQTAEGQIKQAQSQLGQKQSQEAGGSMRRAADALQDAAKQVGQQGQPRGPREGSTAPAQVASQGSGTPTAADLPKDLRKYVGKPWGELPGELRTRIVQDMKAQYGDDYGRIIKLYFEQIADKSEKK